jgi:hypothetical protein
MATAKFRRLERRVQALRRHLLPEQFSPTGAYSARIVDRTRAFQLLAHAEVEAFVEDAVLCAVNECWASWNKDQKVRRPLIGLLSWFHDPAPGVPSALPIGQPFLHQRIDAARKKFSRLVHENQGIKPQHLINLLMPTGIREADIDQAWLDGMREFGDKRGETAHRAAVAVVSHPDPKEEYERVLTVLRGLEKLDTTLRKLTKA